VGIAGMMKSMMRWIARRLQRTDKDAAKDEFARTITVMAAVQASTPNHAPRC
jgi:hypothetical protein